MKSFSIGMIALSVSRLGYENHAHALLDAAITRRDVRSILIDIRNHMERDFTCKLPSNKDEAAMISRMINSALKEEEHDESEVQEAAQVSTGS